MAVIHCPKCRSLRAWVEVIDNQPALRCKCGLCKFLMYETKNGNVVMHKAVRSEHVRLPPVGTKLRRTLMGVVEAHPTPICTSDVATNGNLTNKETASLMMLLMARGLVHRFEERRGILGGSRWTLTNESQQQLSI